MKNLSELYFEERKFWPAHIAIKNARIRLVFNNYENQNKVRIRIENDDIPYDFSCMSKKEVKRVCDLIELYGQSYLISEFFNGEMWQEVYGCAGFIGDDWRDSGYDIDAMSAAIKALDSFFQKEADKMQQTATYAMNT